MASKDDVRVPVEDGKVTLEASLFYPRPAGGRTKLAVFCHPWSWLGGSMNDYVLAFLTPLFLSRSFSVLHYNSRGVGRSTGRSTLRGERECLDLQDVVRWTLTKLGKVERLVLVGYSHGSLLTSRHPLLPSTPTSHLLVSYPLTPLPLLTLFSASTYTSALSDLVGNPSSDVLVAYGDEDNFTGKERYDTWAEGLKEVARGKLRVECVEGADHFWGTGRERFGEVVEAWLDGGG